MFIEDFIQFCQGGQRRLKAILQHLLHAIDMVLARPEVSPESHLEAISLKKLLKGDGSWALGRSSLAGSSTLSAKPSSF